MENLAIVGIDLAKNVFQLHGATASGEVVFRRKFTRARFPIFIAALPPCIIAMEACAGAHHWGRDFMARGHDVRLVPPIYVKPFLKRQKNDAADAEAIVEAALRPTMRFVAVKSVEKQACAMAFKTRDLLVRQRTQTVNALRGHLTEYGVVVPIGLQNLPRLIPASLSMRIACWYSRCSGSPEEAFASCASISRWTLSICRRAASASLVFREMSNIFFPSTPCNSGGTRRL